MTPSEQRYATAWGADPYQDKDLHVALAGGTPQAASFLAFDLSAIPADSHIEGIVATLVPNPGSAYNFSEGRQAPPLVNACIEDEPFPAQFDPAGGTWPWDCSRLSVPVKPGRDGVWGVDLRPFVDEWRQKGNTGLALVGAVSGEPAESWVLSFDQTKTAALATYTMAATAPDADRAAVPDAGAAPFTAPAPVPALPHATPPPPQPGAQTAASPSPAVPTAPTAPAASEPQPVAASSSTPAWIYAFVALWAACLSLFAIGVVMKLRTADHFTPRALLANVRHALHDKSTWLAGVPLLVFIGPLGGAFAYMQSINAHVTPPLAFEGEAQAGVVTTVVGAPGVVTTAPGASAVTDDPAGTAQPGRADSIPAAPTADQPAAPNELDGRWTVATGSVAGYRVGYSSPTGRGTRVGRTESSDGVDGEISIAGTAVSAAQFSVDMRKVKCDGGSQCTDHVNQMMDTANHPFETFVLKSPIELGSMPADGQQVSASVTGELTLRGVTRTTTFTLTGRRNGDRIEVLGSIPVNRDDYSIPDAEEPGFTVDKDGTIEILLAFERAS